MGFSVSGAAAIIFISILLAFGVWFTAASSSFDMITDAQDDRSDRSLSAANTALGEAKALYDAENETLTINVTNTGTTELSLSDTDLLIDGTYISDWQDNASVAGDSDTDLWLSNERLTISREQDAEPSTVKLVTSTGVHTQMAVEVIPAEEEEENGETESMGQALLLSGESTTVSGGVVNGI